MIEDESFHEYTQSHKLIVIGEDAAPFEISHGGVVIRRADLSTSHACHEEADNIIVQQVMLSARNNEESDITVISDDTDVFILLLHQPKSQNAGESITRTLSTIQVLLLQLISMTSQILPLQM